MRLPRSIAAALVLSLTPPVFAQEWENFVFIEDGFEVNFPGRHQVEDTTWVSQYDYELPARVYRASRGSERYSATVVDYRGIGELGVERASQCPPAAEPCLGTQDGPPGRDHRPRLLEDGCSRCPRPCDADVSAARRQGSSITAFSFSKLSKATSCG